MSLPTVYLPASARRTGGTPDPAEVITVALGDKTFRAGRRTAAHIQWTIAELARLHPDAHLHIMQQCFHEGYEPSAGTHDGDGVLDFRIDGLDWWLAQKFLRDCGWACWYRHTGSWAATSSWHVHAVSIGCPGKVGYYVPGQLVDYPNHTFGLAREHSPGLDHSYFPPNIAATIFDYPAWLADQEDIMQKADFDKIQDMLDAQRKSIVSDFLDAVVVTGGVTVGVALNRAAAVGQLVKTLASKLGKPLT